MSNKTNKTNQPFSSNLEVLFLSRNSQRKLILLIIEITNMDGGVTKLAKIYDYKNLYKM